jgi:hypothetical protein
MRSQWLTGSEVLDMFPEEDPKLRRLLDDRFYMVQLFKELRRGDCWCGVGIGDPSMRGEHSLVCVKALQCIIAQEE